LVWIYGDFFKPFDVAILLRSSSCVAKL